MVPGGAMVGGGGVDRLGRSGVLDGVLKVVIFGGVVVSGGLVVSIISGVRLIGICVRGVIVRGIRTRLVGIRGIIVHVVRRSVRILPLDDLDLGFRQVIGDVGALDHLDAVDVVVLALELVPLHQEPHSPIPSSRPAHHRCAMTASV